jgi:hypothetical protein
MNGMTLRQLFHIMFNHDQRHRWYAWRPVGIYNIYGGLRTSNKPEKIVWGEWVEREYDINWNIWRYYEIDNETEKANSTEVSG